MAEVALGLEQRRPVAGAIMWHQHPPFPVAIELALLLMLLHDYDILTFKLLNISKFSAYIMNVT